MKRIDECDSMAVLVALLVVGILLVMGAYRIFSYLCENAALDARTFLLGAACLLLAVVGFLLARRSFRRLNPFDGRIKPRNTRGVHRSHLKAFRQTLRHILICGLKACATKQYRWQINVSFHCKS